jgi:hypothetical protein
MRSSLVVVVVVVVFLLLALRPTGAGARPERSATVLPPPSFLPAAGWWTMTTGPTDGRRLAPEVWAASDQGTGQVGLFNLFVGLRKLTPSGIVIWASTSGRGGVTQVFTKTKWPLRLSSFRVDHGWEGQPTSHVQQRLRWSVVGGWHLDVRVYFGTQHPTKTVLAKAQAELDRLQLPH